MGPVLHRSWRSALALGACASLLFACALGDAPQKKKGTPFDTRDDQGGLRDGDGSEEIGAERTLEPDHVDDDSGAFGRAGERPNGDAGPLDRDAGGGPGPKTYCAGPLGPGDLAIVELMISSKSGAGDTGEWVEIQNARTCWLKVQGVSVESPRGTARPDVAVVTEAFELGPYATFVVAGSADPAKNHGLTGRVFAWNATDVLKNDGDTVIVKVGDVVVDTLTYPAFGNLEPGRALSFPADCAWSHRSSWERWSLTFATFAPGFKGTPNADNLDVACF